MMTSTSPILAIINLIILAVVFIYLGMIIPYLFKGKKKDSNYYLYLAVLNIAAGAGNFLMYSGVLILAIMVVIGCILAIYGNSLRKKEISLKEDK